MSVTCPKCGEDLAVTIAAVLPAQTDLTLSLKVEPGQLMRLDTIAGILSAFRDLQVGVGESMGAETQVFLAKMETVGDETKITTRITNMARVEEPRP